MFKHPQDWPANEPSEEFIRTFICHEASSSRVTIFSHFSLGREMLEGRDSFFGFFECHPSLKYLSILFKKLSETPRTDAASAMGIREELGDIFEVDFSFLGRAGAALLQSLGFCYCEALI
ncbi:hypothetical protein AXF42_Ash021012 [Apostasia shenzhenica]|uniref:Uncharacterized protein n=1 Tax=Apostasia shenzhenica TaxID=1088818 RepID=A0A2I0AEZ0_9ASPA|nr:hypothetical protein AXF42_Ash021012 [Apostasia shenzhenica]